MDRSRANRMLLFLLSASILIALVVLFHEFWMTTIVNPLVVFLWDIIRIFMSIDQIFFFVALIFLFFFLLLRILPHRPLKPNPQDLNPTFSHTRGMPYWRSLFLTAALEPDQDEFLQQRLLDLTVASVISKEKVAETEARRCVNENTLGLPEVVYSYLVHLPSKNQTGFPQIGAWLYRRASKLMQAWRNHQIHSQQEKLIQLLTWLETYLEMNYDKQD
ncbi:MAG TPA: hypothetical protein VN376_06740 [Longilinea sp.]|nr:hypothetical protein [Longilinea sp.]